jgi:hypothetical protein
VSGVIRCGPPQAERDGLSGRLHDHRSAHPLGAASDPIPVPPAFGPFFATRTAELGEPRRLSVRGGAVPGRTLEAGGAPQFR